MQPEMPFVAPARYPLTVLHRPDSSVQAAPPGDGCLRDGMTVCGLLIIPDDLWRPVERRDGDLLCTGCMLPGSAESAESAAEDAAGVLF